MRDHASHAARPPVVPLKNIPEWLTADLTVLETLHWCPEGTVADIIILSYYYIIILLYYYIILSLYHHIIISLYHYTIIPLYNYTILPLYD